MSGSGSAMVALFESAQKSRLCARQLKNQGLFACSVTTKNYGVEEM
jgi:4-diphosphocytidyl-2C-methyl-D-erythritol kinase